MLLEYKEYDFVYGKLVFWGYKDLNDEFHGLLRNYIYNYTETQYNHGVLHGIKKFYYHNNMYKIRTFRKNEQHGPEILLVIHME